MQCLCQGKVSIGAFWLVLISAFASVANGQTSNFVAPPRSISDITAILDKEKPDVDAAQKARAAAQLRPPVGVGKADLARFYYNRARARQNVGDFKEAISDADAAIALGKGSVEIAEYAFFLQIAMHLQGQIGNPRAALKAAEFFAGQVEKRPSWLFNVYLNMAGFHIQLGQLKLAESLVAKQKDLLEQ